MSHPIGPGGPGGPDGHGTHDEAEHTPSGLARIESDPFADPGLPAHLPRRTDIDVKAATRAERQVAGLFGLATLLVIGFVLAYVLVRKDVSVTFLVFRSINLQTALFGLTLGGALFAIGAGAIHWGRTLMAGEEMVEQRHALKSSDEDNRGAQAVVQQGIEDSGFGRRKLIRNSLLGALGVLALPPLLLLRDLGPLPRKRLFVTAWAKEQQVVYEVSGLPVKAADIPVGSLISAKPKDVEDINEIAKASIIVIRILPDEIVDKASLAKSYNGIMAFSKICTHAGCPMGLYEQQTHHALCPCHQSTFDLSDGGNVVFGPAARSLPQLAITVDADGYLVSQGDFGQPVGPSFWERG